MTLCVNNVTTRNHNFLNQIPRARKEIHPHELLTLEPNNYKLCAIFPGFSKHTLPTSHNTIKLLSSVE